MLRLAHAPAAARRRHRRQRGLKCLECLLAPLRRGVAATPQRLSWVRPIPPSGTFGGTPKASCAAGASSACRRSASATTAAAGSAAATPIGPISPARAAPMAGSGGRAAYCRARARRRAGALKVRRGGASAPRACSVLCGECGRAGRGAIVAPGKWAAAASVGGVGLAMPVRVSRLPVFLCRCAQTWV